MQAKKDYVLSVRQIAVM